MQPPEKTHDSTLQTEFRTEALKVTLDVTCVRDTIEATLQGNEKKKKKLEMMNTTWIYAVIICLVSGTWSLEPAVRNVTFNVGSDANLTCSNKTWSDIIYVIWKIQLRHKPECIIAFNSDGRHEDTCNDGKSLRNTSSFQSYLHIPNFSTTDQGVYKCELVYYWGNEEHGINMAATVPPSVSAWLEHRDNKMVAVCRAERGKPASIISWSHSGKSSSVKTQSNSDEIITVESRLELDDDAGMKNLTCAVRHPYWEHDRILLLQLKKEYYFPWWRFLLVVVFIIVCGGICVFYRKSQ